MGHAWSLEAIARGRGISSTEGSASAACTVAERELWMRYNTPSSQSGEKMEHGLVEDTERAVAHRLAIVGNLNDYVARVGPDPGAKLTVE